jgi:sugar/nucleoside kinase (ribokinase family)
MTTFQPDYLLIGHMTADLTPNGRKLGGTVAYAARTATAFGLKVGVVTSVGLGEVLLNELAPHLGEIVVVPALQTSTFENIYLETGRQQYLRGVASPIRYQHIPDNWRDASLVHFGPLTGEIDLVDILPPFDAATTMLTAQGLLRQWDDDGLVTFKRWYDAAALRLLDWLVLSEEDIVLAPELEQEYAQAANNFVLTRAEKGGTYYANGTPSEYETPPVTVTQPTGAGDVFAAGLLCALHVLGGDVARSLQVAARLGATSVTRDGWEGAPTSEEVEQVLAAVKAG